MVLGTIVMGVYKPTYNWGASQLITVNMDVGQNGRPRGPEM